MHHQYINYASSLKRRYTFVISMFFILPIYSQEVVEIDYFFPGAEKTQKIKVNEFEDHYLYEGDIRIRKDYKSTNKGLLGADAVLWECGRIPYELSKELNSDQREAVLRGIQETNVLTRLQVVPRDKEVDRSYVLFENCPTCNGANSAVGRQGGIQLINIGPGIEVENQGVSIVIHEIIHAAGYWHEQSRADRDQFVRINFENISEGNEHNFDKRSGHTFGDYDFESIMHYASTDFSINPLFTRFFTITKLNGERIPRNNALSTIDIMMLEDAYSCGCYNIKGEELFDEHQDFELGSIEIFEFPVRTGDINGDNYDDIVLMSRLDNDHGLLIRSKLSIGDGQYEEVLDSIDGTAGIQSSSYEIADFNNDQLDDIVFFIQDTLSIGLTTQLILSNGDGTYSANSASIFIEDETLQYPHHITDIDGDGDQDIVFVNKKESTISLKILQYHTDGNLVSNQIIIDESISILDNYIFSGDTNADGKSEIIIVTPGRFNQGIKLHILAINDNATYTQSIWENNDFRLIDLYDIKVGDINADDALDIILFEKNENADTISYNIRSYMSLGDDTFQDELFNISDDLPAIKDGIRIGDINGDGRDDIFYLSNNLIGCGINYKIINSAGDGTYCDEWGTFENDLLSSKSLISTFKEIILTADINGDSRTDLVIVDRVTQVISERGLSFRTKMSIANSSCSSSVDFDEDGFLVDIDCNDNDINIGGPTDWWPDLDGDGEGDGSVEPISACDQPEGYVDNDMDVDDDFTVAVHTLSDVSINIYPNPVKDLLNIEYPNTLDVMVTLYDMKGVTLYSEANATAIESGDFQEGVYVLRVYDTIADASIIEKIVIAHD